MSEYHSANADEATKLAGAAKGHFEQGVAVRGTADHYVRVTVLLSTVLFLTALSQRFKAIGPRRWLLGIAFVLLVSAVFRIVLLPRA